jgi:hypothetical protein
MKRFVLVAALCAGCQSSTFPTGAASLTGAPVAVQSAAGGSLATVSSGTSQLGWIVWFYGAAPGLDCFDAMNGGTGAGSLSIYTGQVESSSQRLAQIPPGVYPIRHDPGPDEQGATTATLDLGGVELEGTLTVTAFSVDDIRGSIAASGGSVQLSGTFDAPSCGTL